MALEGVLSPFRSSWTASPRFRAEHHHHAVIHHLHASIAVTPSFSTFTPTSPPASRHHRRRFIIIMRVVRARRRRHANLDAAMRCPSGSGGRGPRQLHRAAAANNGDQRPPAPGGSWQHKRSNATARANAARYYGKASAQGKSVGEARNVVPTTSYPGTVI